MATTGRKLDPFDIDGVLLGCAEGFEEEGGGVRTPEFWGGFPESFASSGTVGMLEMSK